MCTKTWVRIIHGSRLYRAKYGTSFLNFPVILGTTAHAFLNYSMEVDDSVPQILKERAAARLFVQLA